MLIKNPTNRPSAAQLLQTSFIIRHRERTKLNGPLENTISGNLRSREINTHLQSPMIYGEMKKQNWSLYGKGCVPDDNDYVQSENISSNKSNEETQEDEEEMTLKPVHTIKVARPTTAVKRTNEADFQNQQMNQAIRSNAMEANQNRQIVRENKNSGTIKKSQSFADRPEDNKPVFSNRAYSPAQVSDENNFNNHMGIRAAAQSGNIDSRPITPMRGTYQQIAEKFNPEDNPNYDRSPTRDQEQNIGATRSPRVMSASPHRTMNSLSRTMGPRRPIQTNQEKQPKPLSTTIGSAVRKKTASSASIDDVSNTLKDNPNQDAYGRFAKDAKITTLRKKAIQKLGESTFEKVYDYFVQQRTAQKTNPNFDEAKMTEGLKPLVRNTNDCFLVDQLVFLELYQH